MIETTISLRDNFTKIISNMINKTNELVHSLHHVNNGFDNVNKFDFKYNLTDEVNKSITSTDRLIDRQNQLTETIHKSTQGIKDVKNNTDDASQSTNKNINNWNKLTDNIKRATAAVTLFKSAQKLIELSNAHTTIDARLNMIVDTELEKDKLKDKLYKVAQEVRMPVNDFTNEVAKLGVVAKERFGNVDEMVRFQEIASKSFKISGASATEAAGAMIQLNQAMASGVLQGDEFRSIRENAPLVAQAIAKYMQVPMDKLKDLSSKGRITADIVKNAMLNMGDEIDEKFNSMSRTLADVWQYVKNATLRAMTPILDAINKLVNSAPFQKLVNAVTGTIYSIITVVSTTISAITVLLEHLYNHWNTLKYPVGIFIGLLVVGNATMIKTKALMLATAVALKVKALAMGLLTVATTAYTGAQTLANAALNAFPLVAVISLIIGTITVIVALIKHLTNTATVVGTLGGIFFWLGAVVSNVAIGIVNVVIYVVNKIFDAINALRNAFNSFLNWLIDSFYNIFNGIGEKISGTLGFIGKMLKKVGINVELGDNFKPLERKGKFKTEHLSYNFDYLEYKDPSEAFKNGVRKTENLMSKLKSKGMDDTIDVKEIYNVPSFDDLLTNVKDTKKNTGKMAKDLRDTTEELKYLRELAEQEHINKFTTAEIKVEMNNNNNMSSGADVDSIIYKLTQKLEEKLKIVAEGDY